jgi:hypothetical protein
MSVVLKGKTVLVFEYCPMKVMLHAYVCQGEYQRRLSERGGERKKLGSLPEIEL